MMEIKMMKLEERVKVSLMVVMKGEKEIERMKERQKERRNDGNERIEDDDGEQ